MFLGDVLAEILDPFRIVVAARTSGARRVVPVLPRDVIRSMNTTHVYTREQLRNIIKTLKPGSPVTLQVQREGRLMDVSFTVE